MAGLAAAIGGFAQGVGQGLKLRNDLEDSEARRKALGVQTDLASQQLENEKEKAGARKEAADLITGYKTGNTELGFVRNEDGSYDPSAPENVNRYYQLSELSAARVANAHGQSPGAAINEVRKLKKDQFAEGVNQASALYNMGDLAGGDAALKRVYPLFKDGRDFLGSSFNPNDPKQVDLRYKDQKTGEERVYTTPLDKLANNIIPLGLNLVDASNRELASRKLEQENANTNRQLTIIDNHYKRADENDANKNLVTQQHYNEWFTIQKANVANEAKKVGLMSDQVGLQKVEAATSTALNQISTLVGFNPKFDPTKASETDILKQEIAGAKLQSAAFIQQQGGFDKNGFKVQSGEAAQLVQQAYAPENLVNAKQTKNGMYYVQVGDTAVPVIGFNEGKRAALQKQLGQQPTPAASSAPAAPARGISTPAAAANSVADSLPPEAQKAGLALDGARARLSQATANVQKYGLQQRRADPTGYQAALKEVEDATNAVRGAESAYQSALPGVNPVTNVRGIRTP